MRDYISEEENKVIMDISAYLDQEIHPNYYYSVYSGKTHNRLKRARDKDPTLKIIDLTNVEDETGKSELENTVTRPYEPIYYNALGKKKLYYDAFNTQVITWWERVKDWFRRWW